MMKIGSKIRTLYQYSQTGVIVKPRKHLTPPGEGWFLVCFDDSNGKLWIHREMLALRNDI